MRAKAILKRIGILLACAALLSYTVFHIVSLFKTDIATIVVGESRHETRLGFDGYVFRNEAVITSNNSGAVDYIAHDGLKVSANETLAYVYERGNSSEVSERVKIIDRDIAVLTEALSKKEILSSLPELNNEARDMHVDIMQALSRGEFRGLRESIDSFTVQADRIASATGDKELLASTLASLKSERDSIIAAGGNKEEIKSGRSGYFYSAVDGYESTFTVASAEGITHESFKALVTSAPSDTAAVGKMAYDSEWRFVALLSAEDAVYFEEGMVYELIFTGNGDVSFPLTLMRSSADEATDTVLLVFFCDRAPSSFSFERFQSVEAVVESVSGITVPRSAVHRASGEYYVYILSGSVVLERRIEVLYAGSDFYIVRNGEYIDSEDGVKYLKSNDVLITEGNNLFDGRIID